jgi:hypothetical protein
LLIKPKKNETNEEIKEEKKKNEDRSLVDIKYLDNFSV